MHSAFGGNYRLPYMPEVDDVEIKVEEMSEDEPGPAKLR